MKKINSISVARMANSLYVQFHVSTVTLVENYGCQALGLVQSTFDEYKAVVEEERDYVNRTLTSPYTERLAELDSRRVELTRYILAKCRYAKISADATVQAAAGDLHRLIVKPYPLKALREGGQTKAAVIGGLLVDLEKIDGEVLKALGIDVLAKELQTVNDSFTQAYLARNAEYEERGIGTMQGLREQGDRLYEALCLQLTFTANRSDKELAAIDDSTGRERATAQRTLAARFMGELNQHIKFYKAQYLNRGTGAAGDVDDGLAGLEDEADGNGGSTDTGGATSAGSDTGGSKPTGPTDVTEVV